MKYDEHNLSHAFKFGVIYQKKGQVILLQLQKVQTENKYNKLVVILTHSLLAQNEISLVWISVLLVPSP